MTFMTKHISISINCPATQVYRFASNPANLPEWAAGLSGSIQKINGEWVAESLIGKVKVAFAAQNTWGVLDHDVTLPSGVTFYNPMRVFSNDAGSEVVFTLYRRPGMSEQDFTQDIALIEKDLEKLKTLLEK